MKDFKELFDTLIDFSVFHEQVSEHTDEEERNDLINKIAISVIRYFGLDDVKRLINNVPVLQKISEIEHEIVRNVVISYIKTRV
jgi:hypothetical protein